MVLRQSASYHVRNMWPFILLFMLRISSAALSYRSDGPNVEYKSLRNLEMTPYLLRDGTWYRDMLTIEASRAVGHFAKKPNIYRRPALFNHNQILFTLCIFLLKKQSVSVILPNRRLRKQFGHRSVPVLCIFNYFRLRSDFRALF